MGREIRRVPGDWQHPKFTREDAPHSGRIGDYRPLYNEEYHEACAKWYADAAAFKPDEFSRWHHEYAGPPPDEQSYRDRAWTPEEATHIAVYETVSEGTPVTPAFATPEELIEYLVQHGDFWDQKRGDGGWKRENAESFVGRGWAPSLMVNRSETGTTIHSPRDGMP